MKQLNNEHMKHEKSEVAKFIEKGICSKDSSLYLLCRGRKITNGVAFFFQILPNLHFITTFSMSIF